jgi:hypothetical protein
MGYAPKTAPWAPAIGLGYLQGWSVCRVSGRYGRPWPYAAFACPYASQDARSGYFIGTRYCLLNVAAPFSSQVLPDARVSSLSLQAS